MSTTLDEHLTGLIGKKRKFILLRISGLDLDTCLATAGVTRSAYGKWTMEDKFSAVYTQWEELAGDHREEAIRLLRKENQLAATLLEREIIDKLREEVATGILNLAKTHLGREVYSKLIAELDKPPTKVELSWEQRILQLTQTQGGVNDDTISITGSAQKCLDSGIIEETIQINPSNLQASLSGASDSEEDADNPDVEVEEE